MPGRAEDVLNLRAAQETDAAVERLIAAEESFVVETVLSSPKYRDDVEAAKARGFRIGLIYVSLHPPELASLRVGVRVGKGGHAVAPEKVIERYHRSHAQLSWFAARTDLLIVFDNSDAAHRDEPPAMLAVKLPGQSLSCLNPGVNPAVDRALDGL